MSGVKGSVCVVLEVLHFPAGWETRGHTADGFYLLLPPAPPPPHPASTLSSYNLTTQLIFLRSVDQLALLALIPSPQHSTAKSAHTLCMMPVAHHEGSDSSERSALSGLQWYEFDQVHRYLVKGIV